MAIKTMPRLLREFKMTVAAQKKLDTIIAKIEVLQNEQRLSQQEIDALRTAKGRLISLLK